MFKLILDMLLVAPENFRYLLISGDFAALTLPQISLRKSQPRLRIVNTVFLIRLTSSAIC